MTDYGDRPYYYGTPTTAIPRGPIESDPRPFLHKDDFAEVLATAFAGVELGAYDRRIITWLARWDGPTIATIVSLVHRARAAAVEAAGA